MREVLRRGGTERLDQCPAAAGDLALGPFATCLPDQEPEALPKRLPNGTMPNFRPSCPNRHEPSMPQLPVNPMAGDFIATRVDDR